MEEEPTSLATETVQAAINLANQEFIKGFLAGQLILALLMFLLLKVFLFRGRAETRIELIYRKLHRYPVKIPVVKRTTDRFILDKLQHQDSGRGMSESCDWLTLFLARLLSEYRDNQPWRQSMMRWLDQILNESPVDMLEYQGPITITEFSLGEEFPLLKHAAVQLSAQEQLDQITLGIDTCVLVNWPKPGVASLPVSLSLSVIEFAGTIRMEVEPGSESHPPMLSLSLLNSTTLDLEVKSLLGHRTKIKDLPKLTAMIVQKIKASFTQEIVWPNGKRISLPQFSTWQTESTETEDEEETQQHCKED